MSSSKLSVCVVLTKFFQGLFCQISIILTKKVLLQKWPWRHLCQISLVFFRAKTKVRNLTKEVFINDEYSNIQYIRFSPSIF